MRHRTLLQGPEFVTGPVGSEAAAVDGEEDTRAAAAAAIVGGQPDSRCEWRPVGPGLWLGLCAEHANTSMRQRYLEIKSRAAWGLSEQACMCSLCRLHALLSQPPPARQPQAASQPPVSLLSLPPFLSRHHHHPSPAHPNATGPAASLRWMGRLCDWRTHTSRRPSWACCAAPCSPCCACEPVTLPRCGGAAAGVCGAPPAAFVCTVRGAAWFAGQQVCGASALQLRSIAVERRRFDCSPALPCLDLACRECAPEVHAAAAAALLGAAQQPATAQALAECGSFWALSRLLLRDDFPTSLKVLGGQVVACVKMTLLAQSGERLGGAGWARRSGQESRRRGSWCGLTAAILLMRLCAAPGAWR